MKAKFMALPLALLCTASIAMSQSSNGFNGAAILVKEAPGINTMVSSEPFPFAGSHNILVFPFPQLSEGTLNVGVLFTPENVPMPCAANIPGIKLTQTEQGIQVSTGTFKADFNKECKATATATVSFSDGVYTIDVKKY